MKLIKALVILIFSLQALAQQNTESLILNSAEGIADDFQSLENLTDPGSANIKKDVEKLIPYRELKPMDGSDKAVKKIADQSLQLWFESPEFRSTFVGRVSSQFKDLFNLEVSIKGGQLNSSKGRLIDEAKFKKPELSQITKKDEKIEHKFKFNLKALENKAEIKYSGWTNAQMNMDLGNNAREIQVREKVFNNKEIYISHFTTEKNQINSMGLRWSY